MVHVFWVRSSGCRCLVVFVVICRTYSRARLGDGQNFQAILPSSSMSQTQSRLSGLLTIRNESFQEIGPFYPALEAWCPLQMISTSTNTFLLDFTTSRFAHHLCFSTHLSVSLLRNNEKFLHVSHQKWSSTYTLIILLVNIFASAFPTAVTTQNILR
jgi:hypothetical protein